MFDTIQQYFVLIIQIFFTRILSDYTPGGGQIRFFVINMVPKEVNILGSIPASSDIVESEGGQNRIMYIKRRRKKTL
jgi:hypothetical protein